MRTRTIATLLLCLAPGLTASATRIEGQVTYDGLPVNETFPALTCGVAAALSWESGEWIWGTVDPESSTYSIDGADDGTWFVTIVLRTGPCPGDILASSGEVTAWGDVEVMEGSTARHDMDGYYAYRITEPLDSAESWAGTVTDCPPGAPVPQSFTLRWDAVPRAETYDVVISHEDCSGVLAVETPTPDGLSVPIEMGTVPGELFLSITIRARTASGLVLTTDPTIDYGNGAAKACLFHLDEGTPSDRTPHPGDSVFVPQVAHAAGVAPTFWTSDLILSNPGNSARNVRLVFTPRNANGLTTFTTAWVEVPARGSRTFSDVLGTVLGTDGAGSLEVSPAWMEVTSRVSTPAGGGGTYGQGYPALGPGDMAFIGGRTTTLAGGGVVRGAFRTNLALVETWGETVAVTVRLLDRDGTELGVRTMELPPYGNTQINDVVGALDGPATLEEGQVTVTVDSGAGHVGAVLSVVDNTSQDPTTRVLVPR